MLIRTSPSSSCKHCRIYAFAAKRISRKRSVSYG